ncbi:unnamed protein product [Diatraea saccharalis]|uniref:Uncharacterized protein n=1 Tax=Diatraea saccharalis TaxID=40085 RepID=A0A9N9QX46_9NEOP|nr:unnamed protein product [Diatraea saccharalis]
MFKYIIYVLLVTVITSAHDAPGKKPKRGRRPTKEENSTPQPSVISYSTFGFNDVGSYDGFVPTSPDYVSYLSNGNRESSTRLYAPAFPSAPDTTGFNGDFGQLDGFGNGDHGESQNYPQNTINFFSTPTFDNSDAQNKYLTSKEAVKDGEGMSGPIYGTKINSKGKKNVNLNDTEFHVYSSGPVFNSNELVGRFKQQEVQDNHDSKLNNGESVNNDQNVSSYVPNYPSPEINIDKQRFVKAQTNQNALNFPRVVDFTKVKQYYPSELDNKYQVSTYSSILSNQNENSFPNINENQMNQFMTPTQAMKESPYNTKLVDQENENMKQNVNSNIDYSSNFIKPTMPSKTSYKNSLFNSDFKDNYKNKWFSENVDSDSQNFRNPFKGYEYSTDYSNTSFKYEYIPERKPYSTDELVPASSNIDLTSYNIPDIDYSKFKKIPEVKIPFDDDDFEVQHPSGDKFKSEEFLNQFKNLYTTTPPSKWSNIFKSTEFPFKHRNKRPQYDDSINNEMVYIPKRPYNNYRHNYGNNFDSSKLNEYSKLRPHKSNKFEKPKDTRFTSEEDLLDLRNHDTSHPSHLPSQRPNGNDLLDDSDYKKLVEKWRQSYWKSKYRDAHRDYESFASEERPLHVPIPKPYPVSVD